MKVADIVIYALGGGLGHLVRATSISRAIKKIAGETPIIISAPGIAEVIKDEKVHIEVIDAPEDPGKYREIIIERLKTLSPSLLAVDALPMGLMGELRDFLPQFEGRKVFTARILRDDYRRKMNIDEFIRDNYDLVIKAEKIHGWDLKHPNSIQTSPILIRNAEELPHRKKARKMLKVPPERILVMVVSTHQPVRADAFFQMVYNALMRVGEEKAVVKFASPYGDPDPSSVHTSYFPMIELMPGIDIVVGHGGYHLTHEANAVGVPFLVFPQEKLYDDQQIRVAGHSGKNFIVFRSPPEAEEGLRKIMSLSRAKRRKPNYTTGAHDAAKAILELYSN